MRQHLARGTRKKKIRIYRSSPRARSNNTKLKFYCNARCIAYFKINPCIFILCTLKNTYILTQALEALHVFELFVYISLSLLRHSMRSRFSMYLCILLHSMCSRFSMCLCILIHSMHSRFSMCLCILIHSMHASYSCTLICPC